MYSTTAIASSLLCHLTRSLRRSSFKWPCVQATTRLYAAGTSQSTVEVSKSHLRKYRQLERHFKRRLRATHQRFADVSDDTVLQGRCHVYVEDGGGIYRMGVGQGAEDVECVLHADWLGAGGGVLQRVRLSPGECVLAATVKTPHSEEARCILVRLGDSLPHQPLLVLEKVFSFEWATDHVLFYSSQDALRCLHIFRLHLSDAGAQSSLVYEEQDSEFFVEVSRSRDGRLVTLNCSSKSSSEVWMIDSWAPLAPPTLVQPRVPGLLYHVEHSHTHLLLLANTGPGQEYQLLAAPQCSPSMPNWVPVFTPAPGAAVRDMEVLRDHCVFALRAPSGRLQLNTVPLTDPACISTLQLPPWACAIEPWRARVADRETFGFVLSSPAHPPARYLYSPADHRLVAQDNEEDVQERPLRDWHTTRLEVPSQDGTMVPVTLLHAPVWADLQGAPLLLHVYGAYGLHLHMAFSPESRLLLEHGWALAYCHVRGGGERGLGWHRQGRLQGKQRGLEDLAACIRTLHSRGVSRPELTALSARSAGAVLAGALCNQHPGLLRAVTLQAPFLDVLVTMQDPSLPLTVEERGEWGDPLADPQHRDNIATYCPCHNITPQHYPSMLITAYTDDSRVPLSGVQKYVEKLKRAVHTHASSLCTPESEAAACIILDQQPGGDHFGPDDLDLSLQEGARQLAFLHIQLGLDPQGHRRRRK